MVHAGSQKCPMKNPEHLSPEMSVFQNQAPVASNTREIALFEVVDRQRLVKY